MIPFRVQYSLNPSLISGMAYAWWHVLQPSLFHRKTASGLPSEVVMSSGRPSLLHLLLLVPRRSIVVSPLNAAPPPLGLP